MRPNTRPVFSIRLACPAITFCKGLRPGAMTKVTEGLQSIGIPTGDLPSGAVNVNMPAIFQQIKGTYQEQLENGKVEVWIPPLAVPPIVAGLTAPAKASGKSF